MKLVRIEWLDAQSSNSWHDKNDTAIGGQSCVSVGFLVNENERWLQIAHTDGGNQWQGVFDIPRGCVEKVEVMRD